MITQQLPTTATTTNGIQQAITAIGTNSALSSSNTTVIATPSVQTKAPATTKSSGQDRLVCSLCNKVYRSSAGLRYHKRKRHRGKT